MIKQQRGFALLSVLSMLTIVTMLTLSLMESVVLFIKMSHQIITNHQTIYKLEVIVNNHWENMSYPLKKMNDYSYEVKDLGLYPCVRIVENKGTVASHHWQITIKSTQNPQTVLQLRMAKPADKLACHLPYKRMIHAGMISWHVLDRH